MFFSTKSPELKMAALLLVLMALALFTAACEGETVYVEVTTTPGAATSTEAGPSPTPITVVEEVPVEVTRVVTEVVSEEVIVEITPSPLGSEARPVQILFSPQYDASVIKTRTQALQTALADATGLSFEVGVVDSEETLIALMCAAPQDTIGFLTAAGYVVAHDQCNVQPAVVGVFDADLTWPAGMIVTGRNSGLRELGDLNGRTWGVPDTTSVHNYHYFRAMFADAGVEPAEIVAYPGDNNALLGLMAGEVDFVTATYIPPVMPDGETWEYGVDAPDVWRRLGIPPTRSPIGYVLVLAEPEFGGYRLRDARSGIFDTSPEIFNDTFVVDLSARIPNETIAMGADFPLGLGRDVIAAMTDFATSEACADSFCASDFFGFTAVAPITDAAYEPLHFMIDTLELTPEGVWALSIEE